jgi:NADPH:quinone reductase-like Zn-dependent oxidoreductase
MQTTTTRKITATTTHETNPTMPSVEKTAVMQAIVQDSYGAPLDVLAIREIERPTVGPDEVLVAVRSAGVHIGDWLVGSGLPYIIRLGYGLRKPKTSVPGMEFAGVVEMVGENVKTFRPGDAVFGWGTRAFAQYVAVSQDSLVRKPANISFQQAAAVPISGFTALQALRDAGRVRRGQKVLVIGASGGVGTYAVQIAKSYGAEVTGVCSTRNVDLVRSLGADHVIDYTKEDIDRNGEHYDVILDTAGNRSVSALRRSLTSTGTLVIIGGSGGKWLMGFGRTIGAAFLSIFVSQNLRSFMSKTTGKDLAVLKDLAASGAIRPVIDRTFALTATAQAIDYVGQRHTRGKTVVNVVS